MRAIASFTYLTSEEREITHRINDEFASAVQAVSFTAAKSPDGNVKGAVAGGMEQLHNYASLHHALRMSANNDCIDAPAHLYELRNQSGATNWSLELVPVERPFQILSEAMLG